MISEFIGTTSLKKMCSIASLADERMRDNSPAPFTNVDEPSPMKIERQRSEPSLPEEETKSDSKRNEGTKTADDEDTL